MKRIFLAMFLGISTNLLFADPSSELVAKLSTWQIFQADFTQEVYSDQGVLLQRSTGDLIIEKPHHFYWRIHQPLEQIIVGSENQVEIYEPDLKQIIVKTFGEDDPSEVFLWLLADPGKLSADFAVSYQVPHYILQPHQANPLFSHIEIDFKDQQLEQMILKSPMGQVTKVSFSHIQTNPKISPQQFSLPHPKGVDVLHE